MNCWKFFFNSSDIGKMSSSPQWNHTLLNVDQATKQWATTGAAQVTLGRTKTVSWFVAINAFNKISYDFSWQLDIYIHPIHTTQLLLKWWTILLWSALYPIYHTLLSLLSFEIVIFLDCREMPAKKRRKVPHISLKLAYVSKLMQPLPRSQYHSFHQYLKWLYVVQKPIYQFILTWRQLDWVLLF